jgi:hypothetical protein
MNTVNIGHIEATGYSLAIIAQAVIDTTILRRQFEEASLLFPDVCLLFRVR